MVWKDLYFNLQNMVPYLLLFVFLFSSIHGLNFNCPLQENIGPKCFCKDLGNGPMMLCNNVMSPDELRVFLRETEDFDMFTLSIHDSSLLYIPDRAFKNTYFKKIRLVKTELMALSETDFAFEGLEDLLEEFRVMDGHFTASWSWSQLQNLRRLELIDVDWVSLSEINEPFPPLQSLNSLVITRADIFHITKGAFKELKNLKSLILKNNEISELKRNMFPDPADKLMYLDLSNNKLDTLPSDIFRDMPNLVDLQLANNEFTTLQEDVFSWVISNVESLSLAGNRLRCDCRMRWIADVYKRYRFQATCSEPKKLMGRNLKELGVKDLLC